VRQLRNCLERAILLSNEGLITANELPPEVARSANGTAPFTNVTGPISASDVPMAAGSGDTGALPGSGSLRDVEKQQIIAALEQTGWHRGKAAEMLGISPSTLYRRLRDYNLENRLR
jgi:transcriptional regulator of acetoin/glycerol metabolism